ncbi:chaperone for protein-folding within the ER, fungal-domain-containing protein [Trametes maxima]|nr:chaperone for protein-folding within the ER, fungal-domain-containing protein [Trametes maxima]
MFVYGLLTAALAAVPTALSQTIVYNSAHNATPISGTWSSGSKAVVTGDFANPANLSFNYPKTTGVSYAFTDDGFYEVARYRFTSNGETPQQYAPGRRTKHTSPCSNPSCITGVLQWHHGTHQLLDNGSIVLTPFGDGYQQIQDPCAAESNFIEDYNFTELYNMWQIFLDPTDGPKLHLFNFDGSPVAPLFQVYSTANMLPSRKLRNTTASIDAVSLLATNAGPRSWSSADVMSLVSAVFALGVGSLLV